MENIFINSRIAVELIRSLTIRVEGAVVKPNLITVASLLSIEKIIEIAGGLNNEANPNSIEILIILKSL